MKYPHKETWKEKSVKNYELVLGVLLRFFAFCD